MVSLSMRSLTMAISIVALLVLASDVDFVKAEEVCNGDIGKLANACREFVLKPGPQKDPSPECCQVIKSADLRCVCDHIPKGSEDIVSVEKMVYVGKFCGNPLPSGSKCGGLSVPKA